MWKRKSENSDESWVSQVGVSLGAMSFRDRYIKLKNALYSQRMTVDPEIQAPMPLAKIPPWLRITLVALSGLAVTAVVGVLGFVWIVSRLPIVILLVIVSEAVMTGWALAWIFRRLKVRALSAVVVIATLCGLAGSTYCLYAFYVREAQYFHERKVAVDAGALRKVLPLLVKPGSKEYEQAAADLDRTNPHPPGEAFDEFDRAAIYPVTGHHGFFGYIIARGVPGVMLILVHVGLLVFLAVQLGWVTPAARSAREF